MKRLKRISLVSLLIGSAFFLEGYRENRQLEKEVILLRTTKFTKKENTIKIAHLSDTQFPRLRINSTRLLTTLANEKPDLIFYTGDTIDRTETIDSSDFPYFLSRLTKIAPTYIVSGNHEISHPDYNEWLNIVKNSQATLLENEAKEITVKKEKINIIGLNENQSDLKNSIKETINPELETFLLAHHPEKIETYSQNFNKLSFTAFSGHAHGGQIILPLVGGLFSPNQGYLPKYTDGFYTVGDNQLIVSRGLANSTFPVRINNYPHLVLTTVTNKKEVS